MRFRYLFIAAILGGLVATALPAVAAQVGDAFKLGQVNIIDERTSLRGAVDTANLVLRNTGSGVPLSLKNNTGGVPNGKPPMEVDSRRLVKNLNVDRVDFRHANELIRAARSATGNAPEVDSIIVEATITAPQPGLLVMSGSIDGRGTGVVEYSCSLDINSSGQSVTGTHRTVGNAEDCVTNGAVAVEAGTHDVGLRVSWPFENFHDFGSAAVWVIYVPFNGSGNVPTP